MVYFVENSTPQVHPRDGKGKSIDRYSIIRSNTEREYRPFDSSILSPKQTTTEGPKVIGGASRGLGGRDEQRSQSSKSDKWIPPSAFKRDALPDGCDDDKFRKVRGILNKLTPQTFDRLSDELIGIGLDSPGLLKGVILLIFEKALQEPKYVSMYAQLCRKLSKKVPNFDPPNPDSATTFRRLLLNKCQDEYTNRARASAMYDQRTDRLTPEEEEEKHLVKRKMLGNIKFIGELGKLEMLTHSILHKCCEELVKKTKAEDLECLCQIMRTCGHLLDNDKGKYLMDQYFTRMKELSACDKLPSRIRFMLQDVIELRENSWVPRQSTSLKESPKPIQDIRREASDEMGILDPSKNAAEDFRYLQIDPRRNGRILGPKRNRRGMEDVFASIPLSMTGLGTGPGVITPGEKAMGGDSNGYHHHMNHHNNHNHYRPSGGVRNYNNIQNNGSSVNTHNMMAHHQKNNKMNHAPTQFEYNNAQHQSHHHAARNNHMVPINPNNAYEKAPVAPRFMKQTQMYPPGNVGGHVQAPTSNEELSLRPPTNSIIKRIPPPFKGNSFAPPISEHGRSAQPSPPQAIIVPVQEAYSPDGNNASLDNTNGKKKDKGMGKDEILKKVEVAVEELCSSEDITAAIEFFKEMKVNEKYLTDLLIAVLSKAMDRSVETHRTLLFTLIMRLKSEEFVSHSQFLDCFRNSLDVMGELEADIPRIKQYVAAFAARAVCEDVMSLSEIAEYTEDGKYYPFLLLVLQQLGKTMEKPKVCRLFDDSKLNLMTMLPKTDRTKERLTEILEERELSFLFPLLKIQQDMTKQLQTSPDPLKFLSWIKEIVDPAYHSSQGFISALITVIFRFVYLEASTSIGSDGTNEKLVKEKEKEFLIKFKPLFSEFLRDHVNLQVIAIYALQAAWHAMSSPKVVLLRWFMNLYELDMIEEDAFLKWKEDIRDDYPGKGQALFQVNQWLLLLQEANESEAESEDE